jgi:hypothetical protein
MQLLSAAAVAAEVETVLSVTQWVVALVVLFLTVGLQ